MVNEIRLLYNSEVLSLNECVYHIRGKSADHDADLLK